MKIFSLQTKKHLVVWGGVLGVILNWFVMMKSLTFYIPSSVTGRVIGPIQTVGFSFHSKVGENLYNPSIYRNYFYTNAIFWILIMLIILSIIRHFKYHRTYALA